MDDPYISLALSDQIRHGNYGINTGEHSAPSSSILTPFLLAPASGTAFAPLLPLALNCLGLFATIIALHKFVSHLRIFPNDWFGITAEAVGLYLVAICLNLIGVVFTGMEHSLHIAVTAGCVYGLALFLDTGRAVKWLPWVLVVSPLLRYEGLPLSFGVLLVLCLRGKWRRAIVPFALIVLCLAGFSAFLVSMKLAPMPSSILVKSSVVAQGIGGSKLALVHSLVSNARNMLDVPVGFLMYAAMLGAIVLCMREPYLDPRRWSSRGLMALVLVTMVLGHALAGRFGWLYRYEDYAMVGTLMMGVYILAEPMRNILADKGRRVVWVPSPATSGTVT
jgi:hypothetical protein